ncbi:UDP-N-acetylmuramoyl-L-alanine--D-glutamate ligase [Oceanobacillus piezotolerans]|uniref:UDP-N-acetylmuramoylalanine--D-glutamate ligase n=1 Tax=Oceanobacillus piezotolerans TaxID=2448030 RepID=A0A498D8T2_9BACI|nr:UDP-N-acetylmuramoyl-L-alanine--D-glutamate ligase [Oceanobacillus piezotolerans]RLL45237.1 UDP-N-acetylmuramoyl-L-alanine--D-glutamate ligase [Oceanobacillus piezotolerans]
MKTLNNFPYHSALVLGLAKSGSAAAKALLQNGIYVRVNDMKANKEDEVVQELIKMGAEAVVGSHPLEVLNGMDLLVKNPGIPYDNPIVKEAMKRNIPIITEIELAYRLTESPIVGITGSNGKTTTTTLISDILNEDGQGVKVAGNIGIVATEIAQNLQENETLVLELSSFQLQGIIDFRPKIAVLLNIFEAHLDYHKTLENYIMSKCNIFSNQKETDYLVYNADDPILEREVKNAKAILVPFSVSKKVENGAYVEGNTVYFKGEKIMDRDKIVLVGEHNLENVLAAIAAAKLQGVDNSSIQQVLTTFTGVKHRLQFVTNMNGRQFYNDSKATNVLATQKALSSFEKPVILLAGGLDRGNEFNELEPYLNHVKAMVLFGETKEKLKALGQKLEIPSINIVENVEEAVEKAYQVSDEGDVILLSPACASWDQYRTFEERGDMFVQAVHRLM